MTLRPAEVLVIGYGNPLRGDDGVGQQVAEALWGQRSSAPELAGATVQWAHQLAPEMALDVSRSTLVVFIDAAADGRPAGTVSVRRLGDPTSWKAAEGPVPAGCWQEMSPEAVLALASALYGWCPPAFLVSVSTQSTAVGFGLSRAARSAVPVAAAAARLRISQERGRHLPSAAAFTGTGAPTAGGLAGA